MTGSELFFRQLEMFFDGVTMGVIGTLMFQQHMEMKQFEKRMAERSSKINNELDMGQ